MNCPDLVREFEENYKKNNNNERKSNGKNESKTRKRSTKSKKAKVEASDEEDQSDGESSKANDDESGKTRDHNVSSASTTATHEELMTSNCESLERTRLRSACKSLLMKYILHKPTVILFSEDRKCQWGSCSRSQSIHKWRL